jgi:hypothetical protein
VYASHLSAHAGVAHFVENGCRRRAIVGSIVHDIQHDTPLGLSNIGVFEEVVDKNLKRLSIFQKIILSFVHISSTIIIFISGGEEEQLTNNPPSYQALRGLGRI